jgi:hypothetical protein
MTTEQKNVQLMQMTTENSAVVSEVVVRALSESSTDAA